MITTEMQPHVDAMVAVSEGKRVLWLDHTLTLANEAFEQATQALADADQITRVNGQKSISYRKGGRIDFRSAQQMKFGALRGAHYDIAYVPDDLSAEAQAELTVNTRLSRVMTPIRLR